MNILDLLIVIFSLILANLIFYPFDIYKYKAKRHHLRKSPLYTQKDVDRFYNFIDINLSKDLIASYTNGSYPPNFLHAEFANDYGYFCIATRHKNLYYYLSTPYKLEIVKHEK